MSDSLAGGIFGAAGALYSGAATSNSLGAQAQLNEENAQLALQAGQYNSMRQQMAVTARLGSMRAAFGGAGVASNSGSVLAVLQASATNGEMDVQNILHGAQVKAINYQNEASMEKLGASNSANASYLNAFASIVGGGASTFGQRSSGNTPDTDDVSEEGIAEEAAG